MSFDVQKQERTQEAVNIRDTIKEKLLDLRAKYPGREEYVPDSDLPKWITASAIGKWIETSKIEVVDKHRLQKQICNTALKTFCILMQIEKENSIKYFIERADLAGPDSMLWGMTSPSLKTFLQEANSRQISGEWNQAKCEDFCKAKWKYLAVRFTHGSQARLPDHAILPFCMVEDPPLAKGESKLSRVDFDRRYLDSVLGVSYDPNVIRMMRKELALEPGEKEQNFVRYLQARQKQPHPHIIELYAYYTQKKKANLLMPLLQGDLKGFLTRDDHVAYFPNDNRYLAEMLNLSGAMASLHTIEDGPLHDITGVHHDVRPDNVLLNDGKFVLSDFGIANTRCPTGGQEKESYGNYSWWLGPETYWDDPWHGRVGPKGDIFSLGCIFTELLVHMRGGAQSVMAFRDRRRPDKNLGAAPFQANGKIIEQVLIELKSIQQDPNCVERAQYAGVVLGMLAVDSEERLSAAEVLAKFKDILKRPKSESIPTDHGDLGPLHRATINRNVFRQQPGNSQVVGVTGSSPTTNEHCLRDGLSSSTKIETSDTKAEKRLTVAEAIATLGDKCELETDSRVFLQAKNLKRKQQGQVKLIWKQKSWISDWARRAASCVLFLHGDCQSDEIILSYIAARIIKSAEDVQQPSKLIVLRHFCKENRKNGDQAVLIMIQSLLRQLLSHQHGSNLLDLPSGTFSRISVSSLWDILQGLIRRLPDDMTVLCVIDGLQSYYDKSTRETRARQVDETLPSLIQMASVPQKTHCRFKLLLTASKKSLAVCLSHHPEIGAGNLHSIGREVLDYQRLGDRFWIDNRLAWV